MLQICLPMQGTWIPRLVEEDPTCREQLSLCASTTEPAHSRACAPQQEQPPQQEPHAPQPE